MKLSTLNTPNPDYQPFSTIIPDISGKTYKVVSGELSPDIKNFMGKNDTLDVSEFSFDFDNYGFVWNITKPDDSKETVRVATNGTRFTNIVKKPEDQTQLLVTDAAWTKDNELTVNCRWAETCLTKRLTFKFDGDNIVVEESTNSPFPLRKAEEIKATRV
jgi:hypothetical protein